MSTQAGNKVNLSMSVSADGFVAGPNQDEDNPLGVGGIELHRWHIDEGPESGGHPVNKQVMSEMMDGMGAFIMGRNMFGPIRGEWGDSDWKGWWGDDPPYHAPTYVLTHHAHDPIEMEGGTTFHFVTDGIETALERAFAAAGGKDVSLGGGAETAQQYLRAGLIDELEIHVVPLILGGGARLFENLDGGPTGYECVGLESSPAVAHFTFVRAR